MEDTFKRSLRQTGFAVAAATAFGALLWRWRGRAAAQEFAAGYLVEQSLSVDNLFVFIMLFEYFRVPQEYQNRVLSWGIVGAVLMRGVMIVAGVAAVQRFRWTTLLFAGILFLSAVKLLLEGDDDDEDVDDRLVMRLARKAVGATAEYDGDRFFTETRAHGGQTRRAATPLFLCLVCVELSDVVFAVDSIPAVLGISTDPLVVYSSNIFAIAGLRALYTLVARAIDSLQYLKPAVCAVLVFIAVKMIFEYFEYHISTSTSLVVVAGLLGAGAAASVFGKKKKRKDEEPQVMYSMADFAAPPSPLSHRRGGGANGHARVAYGAAGAGDLSKEMV